MQRRVIKLTLIIWKTGRINKSVNTDQEKNRKCSADNNKNEKGPKLQTQL